MGLLKNILEDVEDFKIGDVTNSGGRKSIVTDIDKDTQSVTWNIKKELDDKDIHKYLTELINKLDENKKNYYDQKRISNLLQKLKFIRNTFKRSSNI